MLLDPRESPAIAVPWQEQPSAALCVNWPCAPAAKPPGERDAHSDLSPASGHEIKLRTRLTALG